MSGMDGISLNPSAWRSLASFKVLDIEPDDTTWIMIASFEDAVYVAVKLRVGHCPWGGRSAGTASLVICIGSAVGYRSFLIGMK